MIVTAISLRHLRGPRNSCSLCSIGQLRTVRWLDGVSLKQTNRQKQKSNCAAKKADTYVHCKLQLQPKLIRTDSVQGVQDIVAKLVVYVPTGHSEQADAPATEKVPGGQG